MAPGERHVFLEKACCGDLLLHAEVNQLLTQVRRDGYSCERAEPIRSFSNGDIICERFLIQRYIGRGGMGEVYAAKDTFTRASVALKTIRAEASLDEELSARLRKELRLARRVSHPNVCRMHDLFHHRIQLPAKAGTRNIQCLSMELLEGETLAQMLKRRGRLDIREANLILRQLAAGLAAAHSAGVIHRDLKPSNIILVESESSAAARAVITDFGLARGDPSDTVWVGTSAPNSMLGTPAYMSPEQLEGNFASVVSDIYSLGVIWYEMVTGRNPHYAPTSMAIAVKRLPSGRYHPQESFRASILAPRKRS
jgi:serine/threonine protein kinase